MKAVSAGGAELGTVTTYYELAQGIMLDLKTPSGSVLIPYRPEFVIRTDIDSRTIVINDTLGFTDAADGDA
jgi:ribosomal 30S subunit maturation factor RimM